MSALFTQCPGDTAQAGTGKVDPARKFKCTMAARAIQKCLALGTPTTEYQRGNRIISVCLHKIEILFVFGFKKIKIFLRKISQIRSLPWLFFFGGEGGGHARGVAKKNDLIGSAVFPRWLEIHC